jgi:hypothetical protein
MGKQVNVTVSVMGKQFNATVSVMGKQVNVTVFVMGVTLTCLPITDTVTFHVCFKHQKYVNICLF